jgi:hypothetical protein
VHEPLQANPAPSDSDDALAPAAPITENASHAVLADDASKPPAGNAGEASEAERWKAEYDAQVESFKAKSAEQREKAERQREEWEKIRAEESPDYKPTEELRGPPLRAEGGVNAGRDGHLAGLGAYESVVGVAPASSTNEDSQGGSPSPGDGRDLVSGEGRGPPATHGARREQQQHEQHQRTATASGSEHSGEHSGSEFPSSLTSSFPSSTFEVETPPDLDTHTHGTGTGTHNGTGEGTRRHRLTEDRHGRKHFADEPSHPSKAPVPLPEPFASAVHAGATRKNDSKGDSGNSGEAAPVLAVTPMIFDSSLSTSTRTWALLASLGINFFLPFVNGVMLGVGEIFAKEIIGTWWSQRPGGFVAKLGLGNVLHREKKRS